MNKFQVYEPGVALYGHMDIDAQTSTTFVTNHREPNRRNSVGSALVRHETIASAQSLVSIDRPPSSKDGLPPSEVYHPLSIHVLALLMPASIFGVLARLGLLALASYDGQSIFPLAYVQSVGCLIMGFAIVMKEPLGRLYVVNIYATRWLLTVCGSYGPLYTALTTGSFPAILPFSPPH